MQHRELPTYQILDIIKLSRRHFAFKTENKSCFALSCRISGESLFYCNGEKRTVKGGEVLYVPIGASYAQECEAEEVICFHLSISGPSSLQFDSFSSGDPDGVCRLFKEAYALWKEKAPNYEYRCMAILYQIIAVSSAGICCRQQVVPSLLEPAMQYLQAHLYEPDLSLAGACERCHISRTYFNRLFGEAYGCTPVSYINKQRIERAKRFLINGNYTNAEIAYLCGFGDVKYFYVVFRKVTGLTTKQYRNAHIKNVAAE